MTQRLVIPVFVTVITLFNAALVRKACAPPPHARAVEWEYKVVGAASGENLWNLLNNESQGNWELVFLEKKESLQQVGTGTAAPSYVLLFKRQKPDQARPGARKSHLKPFRGA